MQVVLDLFHFPPIGLSRETIGRYARICYGRCAGSFLEAGMKVAEVAVVAVRRGVHEDVADDHCWARCERL